MMVISSRNTSHSTIRSINFMNESQSSAANHGQYTGDVLGGLHLNFQADEFQHLQSYSEYMQSTSCGEPVATCGQQGSAASHNKGSTGRGLGERNVVSTGDAPVAGVRDGRGVIQRSTVSTPRTGAKGGHGTAQRRINFTGYTPAASAKGGFRLPPTVPHGGRGVRRGANNGGRGSASHLAATLPDTYANEDANLNEEDEDITTGSEKRSSSSADSEDGEDSSSADSEEGEDEAMEVAQIQTQRMTDYAAFGLLFGIYYEETFMNKAKYRIPDMTGYDWVMRTLSSDTSCYNMFRMTRDLFYRLHDLLVSSHGLMSTSKMSSIEALAIFLWIVGAPQSVRQADNRFERSLETISRSFDKVLTSLCSLAADIIKPKDPNYGAVHPRLQGSRFSPHFDNFIGAIDGTHIRVTVPATKVLRYVNRHGYTSQNVLAICDFDMRFTFVVAGWPGSAHDMRVFNDAVRKYGDKFPHPPAGKFYLVDSGYPNQTGYLAPYRGTKYHLPEFRQGPRPSGRKEVFNFIHSSLRNHIECAFGVLKNKWRVLFNLPSYPIEKQSKIILACMALHNFIRESAMTDVDFEMCDEDENFMLFPPSSSSQHNGGNNQIGDDDHDMNVFRDILADAMFTMRR